MKKIQHLLKDEQGLTLIELLAVVVILAVILGIGAIGIGQVIQNSREDAQVSGVQQVMAAAQVYDAQNSVDEATAWPTGGVKASELTTNGFLKSVTFGDADKVIVTKTSATGLLTVEVQADALLAGSKKNSKTKSYTDGAGTTTLPNISQAKRGDLF